MADLTPRSKTESCDSSDFPPMLSLKINSKIGLEDVKKVDRSIHSDQNSQTSFEKQQLLELQIKQLKRQNNFLKKKLQQLNDQFQDENGTSKFSKTNVKSKKTIPNKQKNIESKSDCLYKSLEMFYQEVKNVIMSVAELYRIRTDKVMQLRPVQHNKSQNDTKKSTILSAINQNQDSWRQKNELLRKEALNKRLERIGLQSQDKRYSVLLQLFMEYYQCKSEHQNKTIAYINQMTEKAMQINRQILERGQSRRLIKESQFTNSQTFDIAQHMSIQNVKKKQFMENLEKFEIISKANQQQQFDDYQFKIKP